MRAGRTILAHCYAEPPFRVGHTFDLDGAAYLIIVCSGAGMFGGDTLRQTVHVERGARVVLTSQAALQVHPSSLCVRDPAVLQSRYVVEDDAELHCQWDPVIPFAGARLDQRFDLRIAAGSRLYWGDALMAGRVTRGEAWRFESLAHELAVRVDSSLLYLERYGLQPPVRVPERSWSAGRARYIGTSLVHHPAATAEVAEAWQRALESSREGVDAGIDLVAPGLIVARLMAAEGGPFRRFRTSYRAAALQDIFRSPQLAGRK
jgi:urease accessory protein